MSSGWSRIWSVGAANGNLYLEGQYFETISDYHLWRDRRSFSNGRYPERLRMCRAACSRAGSRTSQPSDAAGRPSLTAQHPVRLSRGAPGYRTPGTHTQGRRTVDPHAGSCAEEIDRANYGEACCLFYVGDGAGAAYLLAQERRQIRTVSDTGAAGNGKALEASV